MDLTTDGVIKKGLECAYLKSAYLTLECGDPNSLDPLLDDNLKTIFSAAELASNGEYAKTASLTTPLSEISQRIKTDLWQGNLYFIPRDDPEDKPENIDEAIRTARTNLQMHLRAIIQTEQKEKAALEQEYKKLNVAEKAAVSTGAAMTGLGKVAKDFLIWADNIVDVVDINRRAVRVVTAAKKTYWEQNKKNLGAKPCRSRIQRIN